MKDYRLSVAAQSDLREIQAYTKSTWGENQAMKYLSELRSGMEKLAEFPSMGRMREDIAKGLRCLPITRHVIFYREYPAGIEIVRVLHASMDVALHFVPRNTSDLNS
ncbi:type II toxin-antitoxin system RelE/ParE family toxin [Methylomagnum sp.]